jgi:hypothetical protein
MNSGPLGKQLEAALAHFSVEYRERLQKWIPGDEGRFDTFVQDCPTRTFEIPSSQLAIRGKSILLGRSVIGVGVVNRPVTEVCYLTPVDRDPSAAAT